MGSSRDPWITRSANTADLPLFPFRRLVGLRFRALLGEFGVPSAVEPLASGVREWRGWGEEVGRVGVSVSTELIQGE